MYESKNNNTNIVFNDLKKSKIIFIKTLKHFEKMCS